jgi:hypothetical protein
VGRFRRAILVGVAAFGALASPVAAATPKLGHTAVVRPVSGKVLITRSGTHKATRLRHSEAIPLGSMVDVTHGHVSLSTAGKGRHIDKGEFWGSDFVVTQTHARVPQTRLTLAGGDYAKCGSVGSAGVHAAGASHHVRRLWGDAHGHFRTRGKHGSATIRGTKWLTQDNCESTAVGSARGTVEYAPDHSSPMDVVAGTVFDVECMETDRKDGSILASISSFFCVDTYYDLPADENPYEPDGTVGFSFSIFQDAIIGPGPFAEPPPTVDVCIARVGGSERCSTYPFAKEKDTDDEWSASDSCYPDSGAGEYVMRWLINGQQVPTVVSADVAPSDLTPLDKPCFFSGNDAVPRRASAPR